MLVCECESLPLCVCVSVLLLLLPLPLALTVNAFGLRCSRSYYVHFVPQLPQRVARSRCLSFSLSPSLLLSLLFSAALCVFFSQDMHRMGPWWRSEWLACIQLQLHLQFAQNFCRFPLAVKCCCLAACCVPTLLLPFPSGLSVDFINLCVTH